MKFRTLFTALLLLLPVSVIQVSAQKVTTRSENKKPVWLADKTPRPSNNTFLYQVIVTEHANLQEARASALVQLSTYIQQTNQIEGSSVGEIEKTLDTESEKYTFFYTVRGETIHITSERKDEYWEYVSYPDGGRYRCYTLFAVANSTRTAQFDQLTFTRKYGARGFVRSLVVPGWGQMHKGSTAKGVTILAGGALLAGGIVFTENERASYEKKKYEDPSNMKAYSTKVENWETARNVCIGAAAALYVYNLVDALVANGRKRSVVKKAKYLTLMPTLDNRTGDFGIALTYNF